MVITVHSSKSGFALQHSGYLSATKPPTMRYAFLSFLLISCLPGLAQYKADNVQYKTVYPSDLCKTLQANPGYVILDVRSQGEFDDTLSNSPGLNIGHIKGAIHIDIRELPQRWKELQEYKDRPLFVYCSHSQRSRRASRLLSDSGFTRIFNVNQGLTGFYIDGITTTPCTGYTIETHVPYQIVSPAAVESIMGGKNAYTIVDVREDSNYNGTVQSESLRLHGHFTNDIHIPLSRLSEELTRIPKNKNLLIVDDFGDKSPVAAVLLHSNGYTKLNILFNGIDEWVDHTAEFQKTASAGYQSPVKLRLLSSGEFVKQLQARRNYVIIDTRTADEFNNSSKNYWQNIGQIRGAINVPASELTARLATFPAKKDDEIVLYGFNNGDEVYASAKALQQAGYSRVSVLRGGIWTLRWGAHNLAGKQDWATPVVNVPDANQ